MHQLSADIINRLEKACRGIPPEYLLVQTTAGRMLHVLGDTVIALYPVSISALGTGQQADSNKTPLGIHRVAQKFGHGAPAGRVFKDRLDTGRTWTPADGTGEDLILSRILWLEGLEDGVNRGPGIDTYERYIYIHGTCKEHLVGTPASHGCVTMTNADVIDLFCHVSEGTIVIID